MMGTHPAARHRRMGKTHHTEGRPASVAPRTTFHTLPIADVRPRDRGRHQPRLRHPRRAPPRLRLPARPIPHAARPNRRRGHPPLLLHLLRPRRPRPCASPSSACLTAASPPGRTTPSNPAHTLDVMPPAGRFTVPLGIPRSYLAVAAGVRHHAHPVVDQIHPGPRPRQPRHPPLRQPLHRPDPVPRCAGGFEEPAHGPPLPPPRPVARADRHPHPPRPPSTVRACWR